MFLLLTTEGLPLVLFARNLEYLLNKKIALKYRGDSSNFLNSNNAFNSLGNLSNSSKWGGMGFRKIKGKGILDMLKRASAS